VGKQYQTRDAEASMAGLVVADEVTVALAEIAESATEGLLALAVGAGLQVLEILMEESVVALAGPKSKHDPDRVAVARPRAGLGDPGWPPCACPAAPGPRRRRLR
jgi:putative transposase